MSDLFVPVTSTDDEGNEVTNYVPLAEYDNASEVISALPEDLVQSHSEFSRVNELLNKAVKESKKFKTRAQTAEQKLKAKNSGDDNEGNQTDPEPTPTLDLETLRTSLKDEILNDLQAERQQVQQRSDAISNLMKKHRLSNVPEARSIIEASTDPEKTAELLGRTSKQFDEYTGGEVDVESEDFLKNVFNRLNLPT